jgi:hypothetical protein
MQENTKEASELDTMLAIVDGRVAMPASGDTTSVKAVLKIDGVLGPVFARSIEHDGYDYEAVYTGGSLTEYEQASAIETLLADRGGEVVPIDESPFAGDGPDTAVTGRDHDE